MLLKIKDGFISFFKNHWDKIKNYFKKNYIFLIILTVIVLGLVITIAAIVSRETVIPRRELYDKTGFVKKEDFNEEEIVMFNNNFKFTLDVENTHFSVLDKSTNKEWLSHPKGDVATMTNDLRELFILYYERKLESPKEMSVNFESIRHDNYYFRVEENSVEVLYVVGGKHELTREDLPQRISYERFQEKLNPNLDKALEEDSSLNRNIRLFRNQYILVETENEKFYLLRNLDSADAIAIIHDILFNVAGYTEEDFIEDGILFEFEVNPEPVVFEFSVKYTLSDSGLDFRLINDSIFEPETHQIAYFDILPYFGSGDIDSQGHIMIPDGSGVVIDFNNNKYEAPIYNKRIYGSDYALTSTTSRLQPQSEQILMPLYGMNNDGNAFINLIEEGSAMSFLRAGFKTERSGGVVTRKHPYSHYRYYIRERDAHIFSGIGYDQRISVWTDEYNTEDFASKIVFVDNTKEQNYVGMAKTYQEYLVDNKVLINKSTKSNDPIFNLTLLGGYIDTNYFLGIPYNKVKSLTSANEAKEIVDELLDNDITNINLSYQGWANDGIKPKYSSKIKFNNEIGKAKDFKKLAEYLNEQQNINFIPEIYALTSYTDKNISKKNQVIYNMFWENIEYYDYNLATTLPDIGTRPMYPIISSELSNTFKNVNKTYEKNNFENIGFLDLGNKLNSSFHKNNIVFRNDSINNFVKSMELVKDNYNYISFNKPNQYALKYADFAKEIPVVGTNYQLVDKSVPFVQLVLSGYVDYSSSAFNIEDDKSLKYHMLKAIETGSHINFTWSYKDTIALVDTEYSYYFSTHYKNWINDAVEIYDELKQLSIYNSRLVNHKYLNTDGTILEVEYSNGDKIVINYNNLTYEVARS